MKNVLTIRQRQRVLSAVAIVTMFVIWELICVAFNISGLVLPRPSEVSGPEWRAELRARGRRITNSSKPKPVSGKLTAPVSVIFDKE